MVYATEESLGPKKIRPEAAQKHPNSDFWSLISKDSQFIEKYIFFLKNASG